MQNVHCIGDRANRVVLDAMELAIKKYGSADRRLRIEHAQIVTEDDLARAVRLGGMSAVIIRLISFLTSTLLLSELLSDWQLPAYPCDIGCECHLEILLLMSFD